MPGTSPRVSVVPGRRLKLLKGGHLHTKGICTRVVRPGATKVAEAPEGLLSPKAHTEGMGKGKNDE